MALNYDPHAPAPLLLWDTSFSGTHVDETFGDWSMDGTSLTDDGQLYTAVILCLFTDARAPDDADVPDGTDDRRGYWGDVVDVDADAGEGGMGSLMWLFERSALTEDTRKGIEDAARDSLETLEVQGMIVDREVTATINRAAQRIELEIELWGRNGDRIFEAKFSRMWGQIYAEAGQIVG